MSEEDSLIERLEADLNVALSPTPATRMPNKRGDGPQHAVAEESKQEPKQHKPLPALQRSASSAVNSPSTERKSPLSPRGADAGPKQLPGAVPVLPVPLRSPRGGGEPPKSPTVERKVTKDLPSPRGSDVERTKELPAPPPAKSPTVERKRDAALARTKDDGTSTPSTDRKNAAGPPQKQLPKDPVLTRAAGQRRDTASKDSAAPAMWQDDNEAPENDSELWDLPKKSTGAPLPRMDDGKPAATSSVGMFPPTSNRLPTAHRGRFDLYSMNCAQEQAMCMRWMGRRWANPAVGQCRGRLALMWRMEGGRGERRMARR